MNEYQQVTASQTPVTDKQLRYQRILQSINVAIWEYTAHDDQFFIDDNIGKLLGENTGTSITHKQLRDRVHPQDLGRLNDHWAAMLAGLGDDLEVHYRVRHGHGHWLWLSKTGNVVSVDDTGRPTRIVGFYKDITERKREEDAFNKLSTLPIDNSVSLPEKINQLLQLGQEYLGLDLGLVSRIEQQNYTVLHNVPEGKLEPGQQFELEQTYCSQVFGSARVRAWHNIADTITENHSCHRAGKLGAYIGTTLLRAGKPYGTLAFASHAPRSAPFTKREKSLLKLMGQYLSTELTRTHQLQLISDSNQFQQLIFDTLPDLLFVKDDQFRIVRANPAFLSVYPEHMRDSVIGTTTLESYEAEEAEAFLLQDKIALRDGQSEVEETITFPDGRVRTLLTKKIRFYDQSNNALLLGVGRDITALKQAVGEKQELFEAMENTVEGVSRLSPDGCYTYLNEAYASTCGYSPAELVGKPWTMTVVDSEHDNMMAAYQTMLDTGKVTAETRGVRKDGSHFYKRVTMISRYNDNNEFIGHHCFMSNITERKQAEEEILRSNAELQRFAYVASHDLQEPLRMVKSFTQLLEKHYADQLDEQAQQFIFYARDGADRMQLLIQDLLEYARVGHEADQFELVDINELKPGVLKNLADAIGQSDADICWGPMPTISGDHIRISSLFQNLIGNAIKYRKTTVTTKIDINAVEKTDHWLVSVSDNGIGMKPEYCQQIFEPFKRLHRKQEYPGTGMGLSICQKTVEAMGGKIWAESSPEEGTRIYFTAPKST